MTPTFNNAFKLDLQNQGIKAFAIVYGASPGERAYERRRSENDKDEHPVHGYFTWAVVNALEGAAKNNYGDVTLQSLIGYVQKSVPSQVRADLVGVSQTPYSVVEGYLAEDLILSSSGKLPSPCSSPASNCVPTPGYVEENKTDKQKYVWINPHDGRLSTVAGRIRQTNVLSKGLPEITLTIHFCERGAGLLRCVQTVSIDRGKAAPAEVRHFWNFNNVLAAGESHQPNRAYFVSDAGEQEAATTLEPGKRTIFVQEFEGDFDGIDTVTITANGNYLGKLSTRTVRSIPVYSSHQTEK